MFNCSSNSNRLPIQVYLKDQLHLPHHLLIRSLSSTQHFPRIKSIHKVLLINLSNLFQYFPNFSQGLCLKVSLKTHHFSPEKLLKSFFIFSLYISQNYIPLSRPHYIPHTKYICKVDKPMIFVMIASETDINELIS